MKRLFQHPPDSWPPKSGVARRALAVGNLASGIQCARAFLAIALVLAQPLLAVPLELPFELDQRHRAILISAEINGKPVTLILDTGATQTILDAQLLGLTNLDLKMSRFSDSGPGLRGEAVWATARVKLGERTWHDQRIVAMNLKDLTPRYGRPVHGILGQDILSQFDRVTIDFRARTLVLSSGKDNAATKNR
jgi:hypothetical protein